MSEAEYRFAWLIFPLLSRVSRETCATAALHWTLCKFQFMGKFAKGLMPRDSSGKFPESAPLINPRKPSIGMVLAFETSRKINGEFNMQGARN